MIVVATGHRDGDFLNAEKRLIDFFKLNNVTQCITGMARGWDTIFAKCALDFQIPLKCYVPYRGQQATSEDYHDILSRSSSIVYCSEKYYTSVFLDRDEEMVDSGNIILSFWDGRQKGGTYFTIRYAKKSNKPVFNLY